jgi:hypothetical protein
VTVLPVIGAAAPPPAAAVPPAGLPLSGAAAVVGVVVDVDAPAAGAEFALAAELSPPVGWHPANRAAAAVASIAV